MNASPNDAPKALDSKKRNLLKSLLGTGRLSTTTYTSVMPMEQFLEEVKEDEALLVCDFDESIKALKAKRKACYCSLFAVLTRLRLLALT